MHVLSEAEWLPLHSKYCLITPSDLGNDKWLNGGFPAGLFSKVPLRSISWRRKQADKALHLNLQPV